MTTAADLERALSAAGLHAPVRWDEVTGSTNETAAGLAAAGAPEWTLVAAGHQTAGRGRLDREWDDVPGGAMLASIVLRPDLAPDRLGLVSLLAGAALARACREVGGLEVRCAWPNDLVLGRAKLAGILAESTVTGGRVSFVVLGAGVNLRTPASVPGAAGLGEEIEPAALLTAFLVRMRRWYAPADPTFASTVCAQWRTVSATVGEQVEVRTANAVVRGMALDVDDRGGLVVRTDAGEVTVAFGDVRRAS
jgi:BirA family biotin operon repressor/biotin-[acetyl-CoA-carboxylase] ligase